MPLDEAAGCLELILRLVLGVIDVCYRSLNAAEALGYLGSWTVRVITWGHEKPDPESWGAMFYGFITFVLIGAAAQFFIFRT